MKGWYGGLMKYNNTKVLIDGRMFDSKREGERYKELKLLERAGKITDLILQPRFELIPKYEINGRKVGKMEYIADFQYTENGKTVVEDAKGFKTKEYLIKKKLFEFKYGIEIAEI